MSNEVRFNGTKKEFAELIGEDYVIASNLVAFLVSKGLAKKTGSRPAVGGKGKPADLFEVPLNVALTFGQVGETEASHVSS